jgi:hypothetical protein
VKVESYRVGTIANPSKTLVDAARSTVEHTCPLAHQRHYRVARWGGWRWFILDKLAHSYIIDVNFCPWCGKELERDETRDAVE